MTAPPFAYYGGKTRLASRIVELLPAHEHYIEPFAGGLSVLLAKETEPHGNRQRPRRAADDMTGQGNGGNQARTEVIWSNRPINEQPSLFADREDNT